MIAERDLIVAYEMGLGKTPVTIAVVEELIESGEIGGGLLIVPSSLKYQWRDEILKFTNGVANVMVINGGAKDRLKQYAEIKAGRVEYAILNYEQVVNDFRWVRRLPRDFIVLDEATAIKGFKAKRSQRVKELKARYKWALTGQPVENRAEEAFSIMEWIDDNLFGPFEIFDQHFIIRNKYGVAKGLKNVPTFHRVLSKRMVRATWDSPGVREQMPKVSEESYIIDFDPAGARLYRHIAADLLVQLQSMDGWASFNLEAHYSGDETNAAAAGQVMSRLMCLRMLCDHPDLLRLSAGLWDGTIPHGAGTTLGSMHAAELKAAGLLEPTKTSRKIDATVELIAELLDANPRNKIVVFSFFKESLRILADRTAKQTKSTFFTGDQSLKARHANKVTFQTDPECRVLFSSDAGGYGVDLPQANYLISLDLPWSAGAWKQRNARIIRLSSEFQNVTLISMLMSGSIEERQYSALAQKQAIASAILDGKGHDTEGVLNFDLASLTEFLETSEV